MDISENNKKELVKIICLTPIKNEAWILELFLKSASVWADHIIIADQNSSDGSKEIAKKFPKVILIENKSNEFNEPERQKMLIDKAREIEGKKLFVALDADEFITSNSFSDKEWSILKNLEKGTIIKFDWVNCIPDKNIYWLAPNKMPFSFMDDGSDHIGSKIHSPRVPISFNNKQYLPTNIKIMHFQYADWARMESKHRWYQCWEKINNPKKSCIEIYRQYHHMFSIAKKNLKSIPPEWTMKYNELGIDLSRFKREEFYRWDFDVLEYFETFGLQYFSKLAIWEYEWNAVCKKTNSKFIVTDPRNTFEKILQRWLKVTQPYANNILVRMLDAMLIYTKFI